MYKASFDNELLNDWCDFCEGKKEFDKFHFSTLLMETLLEGYTPEFDAFISKTTKYFDISIYENIKYAFSDEKKSQGNVKDWVLNENKQMKKDIMKYLRIMEHRILNNMMSNFEKMHKGLMDDLDQLANAIVINDKPDIKQLQKQRQKVNLKISEPPPPGMYIG